MSNNIVLGAGKVYFALEDAQGAVLAERYIGDTPGFSVNVNTTELEVFDSDNPIAEKLVEVATQITRDFELTVRDVSEDNLSAFLIADAADQAGSGAALTTLRVDSAELGRYYQLGESSSKPGGARDVTGVSVTIDPDGTPSTATVDVDYTVDAALGRVYLVPGGGISEGDVLDIDATDGNTTRRQISTNADGAKVGALRYIADNTKGVNRDVYIPKCQLRPNGAFAMKSRDTVQEMGFAVGIQERTGYAQVYVDGRAA